MQENFQHQFQGGQISRVPSCPGLYAWYYKPLVLDEKTIVKVLSSFIENSSEILTEVEMRYGLKLVSKSLMKAEFGVQKQSAKQIIHQVVEEADSFFMDFFKSDIFQSFSRPIYIGIAKNLNTRIYKQHYLSLVDMHDMSSPVTSYLTGFPETTVQDVMNKLSLPHSFALEARVRNIAPRDLTVHVFTTNSLPSNIGIDSEDPQFDAPSRRALERLLQLIADPICGRR